MPRTNSTVPYGPQSKAYDFGPRVRLVISSVAPSGTLNVRTWGPSGDGIRQV